MLTVVRRFLLLLALMFWQGGFMFHGAVVIHVGRSILGSHLEQGYITGAAANYLNLAGVVVLAFWGWDMISTRDPNVVRSRLRWGLWALLASALGLLAWLHLRLDELLDFDPMAIRDRSRFYALHAWYLNISTAQWGGSLMLIALTLIGWRSQDRGCD